MITADFIYRFVPNKTFRLLQKTYHRWKRSVYNSMTEEDFYDILNRLGIKPGDVIFVHSSYDKLNTAFSAKRLLDILLERVGNEGTLLFPSWNYSGRTEDYVRSEKVFDVKKTFTRMGLIPELARRKRSAIRSLHPTASIAAIGKHAAELTSNHNLTAYACGEESPYFKMMKYHAKIIGLGEKTVSMSFLHCVEDVMQADFPVRLYYPETFKARYKDYEGNEKSLDIYVHNTSHRMGNIPSFIRKHISSNACRQFNMKGRNYFVADSVRLFDELTNLAKNGKTIYRT